MPPFLCITNLIQPADAESTSYAAELPEAGWTLLMQKLVAAASSGILIASLMFSTTALAADGAGASNCGRAAGAETATAAKYFDGLGVIISNMSPINEVNQASLCLP